MPNLRRILSLGFLALLLALPASPRAAPTPALTSGLRCLIVGGGPSRRYNPVALENNIIYIRSLLPAGTPTRILYANADLTAPIVQVWNPHASGRQAYSYRSSALGHVDGPATVDAFQMHLDALADGSQAPLLLYFTGHGSPDPEGRYVNNAYALWHDEELYVNQVTRSLQGLNPSEPVTLVMVQCFSGAFAEAFFAGSSPGHPVVRLHSCGFFASVPEREAAGCTPDINQADYHDFTTYFFGALTGRDRVGRRVAGADYDHDGVVEMDEAYAYTICHDVSIDTPVATTDAYVRRFTTTPDAEIMRTPYASIVGWASPAQKAALESMSSQLGLTGDDRLQRAYDTMIRRIAHAGEDLDDDHMTALWLRFVRLAKTVVLEHQIETDGPADVRAGLDQLVAAEHAPLLPPAAGR